MNGRKHRNRVALIEEEKRKTAAAYIMEEKAREERLSRSPALAPKKVNAWKAEKPTPQPTYTLPPPPHPVPDSIAPTSSSKQQQGMSFRDIMNQESRKAGSGTMKTKSAKPGPLRLPPGSAPALKSPPWASPKAAVVSIASTPTYSLCDFLKPEPKPAMPIPVNWASPQKTAMNPSAQSPSFLDIQQQEQELKTKEDQSCSLPGTWYVQSRERAGSLKEIQSVAEKEREEQLFLQEQLEIERQIMEELENKKKVEAATNSTSNGRNRGRKNISNRGKKGKKSEGNANSSEDKTADEVKAKKTQRKKPTGCKDRKQNSHGGKRGNNRAGTPNKK